MNKEFNKLQKENDEIRNKIEALLEKYFMKIDTDDVWVLINGLIENELQQEEFCNK